MGDDKNEIMDDPTKLGVKTTSPADLLRDRKKRFICQKKQEIVADANNLTCVF